MRHVLITGGSRGIGLACCERFVREGDKVTALWSQCEEDVKRAKTLLPSVEFVRADVSREGEIKEIFAERKDLDILVNNAGIDLFRQVQDTSLNEWERVLSVNAGGTFLCTKYAVQTFLKRGGGNIVNIASIWGERGGSCESAYSASKGAVIAFTKAVSKELAPAGICVNCVSPGAVDTKMNAMLTEEEKNRLCEDIPMGRFASPEEIAEVVFFLSRQKYLTGQNILVSGGWES